MLVSEGLWKEGERFVSEQQKGFSAQTGLLRFSAHCQGLATMASVLKD